MSIAAQPIHPDILPRLDPEYVAFHNTHILHVIAPHTLPWDPSIRHQSIPGVSEPLKVGDIKDFSLSKFKIRTFTPEGSPPTKGWPALIYFHGGGWTLGNIASETSFVTNLCKYGNAVVVSVDYRLGPEEPYPAAVEDAVEALYWVFNEAPAKLGIDASRIAVGGSSSGGNLAAVVALKAAEATPPIPLVFQLLIVPVTDNTASVTGKPYASWLENAETPWLNTGRMLWFRNNYLPNEEDRTKWDNSPILAPEELLAKTPKAWIGVTELDILRDEGIAYGDKLKKLGVEVETKVYPNSPHPIAAMDGIVLKVGRQLVADAAAALGIALQSV